MTPLSETLLREIYAREQPLRLHWPRRYEDGMANGAIKGVVELIARHLPAYTRRAAERSRIGLGRAPKQAELEAVALCPVCQGTGQATMASVIGLDDKRKPVYTACPRGCVAVQHHRGYHVTGADWRRKLTPGEIDRKRAAAGDRDD